MSKKHLNNVLIETVVGVVRVTKVVKGGRKFSFSACVVSGDKNGRVGYGKGKAKEVSDARTKATQSAKNNAITVPLYQDRTIHYDVEAKFGAARVILRRAAPGTGIIAGGSMRAVFYALGIKDIVAKSIGSSNMYSMISATFKALKKLETPTSILSKRGV